MASLKHPKCLDQEYSHGSLVERKVVRCAVSGEEGDGSADEKKIETNHSGPKNSPREDVPEDLLCEEGEVFYKNFTLISVNGVARMLKLLVSLCALGGEPRHGESLCQQHPSQMDIRVAGLWSTKDTTVALGSNSGEASGDGLSSHVTQQAVASTKAILKRHQQLHSLQHPHG